MASYHTNIRKNKRKSNSLSGYRSDFGKIPEIFLKKH